jgi:hypothetical protein
VQRSEGVKLEKYKFRQHTQTSFKFFYRFVPVFDEWVLFFILRLVGQSNSSVCSTLCENNGFVCEFEDYQFSLKLLCTKGKRNKEPTTLEKLVKSFGYSYMLKCLGFGLPMCDGMVGDFLHHSSHIHATCCSTMCDKIMNEISTLFVVAYQMYLGPKNSNSAQKVPIENDES